SAISGAALPGLYDKINICNESTDYKEMRRRNCLVGDGKRNQSPLEIALAKPTERTRSKEPRAYSK
ncbi:MAG: hypothetical protein AAF195_04590, partial [Pseudomonadota bacterium]